MFGDSLGVTIKDLVEAYIADREFGSAQIEQSLNIVAIWSAGSPQDSANIAANDVDEVDVQEWVDGIRRAPKTVANITGSFPRHTGGAPAAATGITSG